MTKYFGNIDGQFNQLVRRVAEKLSTIPGLTEGRFFYDDNLNRLKVGTNSQYEDVAYLSDLYGISNWKEPVRLATTANLPTIAGLLTIDGVTTVAGDRVLVKDQTDQKLNGVYVVSTGAWTRALDNDNTPGQEIASSMVPVVAGTTNANKIFREIHTDIVLGVDPIIYTQFILNIPTEDKFVKVSASDTTEKYMLDVLDNAVVNSGPALNNLTAIKLIHNNIGLNESIEIGLDLSTYTGDTNFIGNHTQTGALTVSGLSTFANTLFNGTNTYSPTSNSVYQSGSTTSFLAGSTLNIGGNTNRLSTSVQTYTAGSTITGEVTYVGAIINYDKVVENYISAPNQMSCALAPAFGTPYTPAIGAQYIKASVSYNNGIDPVVIKEIYSVLNGSTQTIPFVTPTNTGVITVSRNAGDVTIAISSGNPAFFSFTAPASSSLCSYNGVSQNNYGNKVHIYNGDIFEYKDTYQTNTNVTQVFDSTSTLIHQGDVRLEGNTYLQNLEVNNLTIQPGGLTLSPVKQTANNTGIYPYAVKPSFVYKNGLYMLEGVGEDWVYSSGNVTFTTPTSTSDIIVFI